MAQPKITPASSAKTRPNTSGNGLSRDAIEVLPAAVYMTDAEGRLTFYNEAAVALWGCRPELGESKFCGSWKLYWPDGTPLPHDQCPMAMALRQGRPIRGMEAVAERPDGTRVPFIPYPTPLFDESGRLTGAVNMLVDISERKRAEADLAERQAQLAVFVEHAPAAIAMFDHEMRYLAVSRRYILDFRLPPDAQLIGRSHYEIFPDIPQRWRDVHARVLAGEELSQEEDQFARQDGSTHWVSWSMAPWRRADGSIGGALLFSEHRTEQVEARRALADSEARFRATFENAAVGVVLGGADGSILRANNSFARMLGYSAEELETRTFQDLTHPDDLATNLSVLNKARVGEVDSFCIEKRYVRRDGDIIWANVTVGSVRKTDGVDYFVAVVQDITDRKRAEARLAERNMQLALAAKVGLVGSFAYDADTEMMQISEGYSAIHGFPEGTTEIARSECMAGVYPDDVRRVEQFRSEAFRERRSEYNVEYRIIRPSGELRWVETRCFISFNGGHPQRVVGVSIDVTERKTAEDALRRREAELAEAQRLAHVGNWSWDAATNRLVGSDELFRICGWDPTQRIPNIREQLGRNYSSEDWERLRAAMRDAMQTGAGYVLDLQAFRNGTPIRVTTRGEAIRNGRGQIVGLRGTVQDITERKMAELALAERNLQLALAGKVGLVGSFAYDLDTQRMQISAGYAAIHGFPDGTTEIARSEWWLGVHPEDGVRWEALRSRAYRERLDEYSGEYRLVRSGGEIRWIEARVFVSYDADGRPRRAVGVDIDVTARKRADDHQRMLIAELDHRVKNALATVSAVAACTLDTSRTKDQFVAALDGRIRSMATTHELLSGRGWNGIPLAELLRYQLAPYATTNNMDVKGPDVLLSAGAGQTIGMVFHELITNACKYGALSTRNGRLSVRWDWPRNGKVADRLVMEWREIGGPAVRAPGRAGHGMEVIRDLVPYELEGNVDLAFASEGVRCQFDIPVSRLTNAVRQ